MIDVKTNQQMTVFQLKFFLSSYKIQIFAASVCGILPQDYNILAPIKLKMCLSITLKDA